MGSRILVYGATGRVGGLVTRALVKAGVEPILGGRRGLALRTLAQSQGLEHRVFDLNQPAFVVAGLAGVGLVVNCAGPFHQTSLPLALGALEARCHYLDVNAEWSVQHSLATLDEAFRAHRLHLIPGVGFDVVACETVTLDLQRKLPSASHVELTVRTPGGLPRGAIESILSHGAPRGVLYSNGRVKRQALGSPRRLIDLGEGEVNCLALPLAATVSLNRSTSLANVITYGAPSGHLMLWLLRAMRHGPWLLNSGALRRALRGGERARLNGAPGQDRCAVWGEARDERGGMAYARLDTPEETAFTAQAAAAAVLGLRQERTTQGAGFQSAAQALGPRWVTRLRGVAWQPGQSSPPSQDVRELRDGTQG